MNIVNFPKKQLDKQLEKRIIEKQKQLEQAWQQFDEICEEMADLEMQYTTLLTQHSNPLPAWFEYIPQYWSEQE